jgi:hypothetical protein
MSESILVGVDASTPSRSAIAWSIARAAITGDPVELVHVVDRDLLVEGPWESASVTSRARQMLDLELAFARSLKLEVIVTATLAEGRPAETLAKMSQGHPLLVIGTHKTGFIYGRAFGSRFIGLGWRSRCDVAFIPDRVGYDRQSIVAGVDDSAVGDAVVQVAASEAALVSQELVLVSSWGTAVHAPRGPSALARRAAAVVRAVGLARDGHPGIRIRNRSIESPAAEALVETSSRAALLVIGRRRASLGSSASRSANLAVLLNMSSPVMVVLDHRS